MEGWGRKLRGVVGLTSIGGLAGALLGGVGTAVVSVLGTGRVELLPILLGAAIWGGVAGTATAGVAALLAAGGPKDDLSELSRGKAGLVGAAIGAAAPFLLLATINLVLLGAPPVLTVSVASSMVIGGVLGGALGSGLITAAQKADVRRLEGADATRLGRGD